METNFVSAVRSHSDRNEPAYWFIFDKYRLLVHDDNAEVRIPLLSDPAELSLSLLRKQYLGYLEQGNEVIHCYSGEVSEDTHPPEDMKFLGLRRLFGRVDDETLALAGRAVQIKEWDKTHQYCGQCSSVVVQIDYERAKKCPECGHTTYPRISPAIIVRVERLSESGTELLLARNHRHPDGFFSVLAGFVEPGESLEECVRREVCEEVGLEINNIRYFGSQPWPFPNSLMIAFTADYAGGEIVLEQEELAEAGWYKASALPLVPPHASIARKMIDDFIEKNTDHTGTPGR